MTVTLLLVCYGGPARYSPHFLERDQHSFDVCVPLGVCGMWVDVCTGMWIDVWIRRVAAGGWQKAQRHKGRRHEGTKARRQKARRREGTKA